MFASMSPFSCLVPMKSNMGWPFRSLPMMNSFRMANTSAMEASEIGKALCLHVFNPAMRSFAASKSSSHSDRQPASKILSTSGKRAVKLSSFAWETTGISGSSRKSSNDEGFAGPLLRFEEAWDDCEGVSTSKGGRQGKAATHRSPQILLGHLARFLEKRPRPSSPSGPLPLPRRPPFSTLESSFEVEAAALPLFSAALSGGLSRYEDT
mmetsp:Transcript_6124/g.13610  ORF Transcript_6124/g.13610 Transcript_6124/m.13610 type:complete len:209 (+) Transcript_6124:580-1206(+)